MAILDLVLYPNPLLQKESAEIGTIDKKIQKLINDMIETMYARNGVGLAAPQVGENIRLAVVDVSEERNQPIVLINPVIKSYEGSITSEEGCLSIPGFRDQIKRSETIKVQALDRNGNKFTLSAEDLLSRCLQHEIDHLRGVLFIDHLSPVKKKLFNKWFQKNQPLDEDYEE